MPTYITLGGQFSYSLAEIESATGGLMIASVPGLPRFDLPFAFTIIHGIGRSSARYSIVNANGGKNGGGLGTRLQLPHNAGYSYLTMQATATSQCMQ